MLYHVQYFNKSPVSGKLVEACGDRAVLILDGRNSLGLMHSDARQLNGQRRPTYAGYQIRKGVRFTDCRNVSEVMPLN